MVGKVLPVCRVGTWMVTLAKFSAIVLIIVMANLGTEWLVERLNLQIWPEHLESVDRVVLIAVILYIGLMATPFLPGIEVGLILMTTLGIRGVLVVYVCTIVALTISFWIGKLFPTQLLVSFLRWLNLGRAAALLNGFDTTPPEDRLEFLADKASTRILPTLLKRRYLLLALLFNVPGNVVIGGGGGIAMMAGMSRLYSFPTFILLTSFAVLPGPILFVLSKSFP